MKRLFIGDVHGCAEELEKLIGLAGLPKVTLVGDLFTKGPDPIGVWRMIQAHGLVSVLGNHDAFLLENWNSPQLPERLRHFCSETPEAQAWLSELPLFLDDPSCCDTSSNMLQHGL